MPTWLLRHDGELLACPSVWLANTLLCMASKVCHCCAGHLQKPDLTVSTLDRAFWDPVSGKVMDSRQCLDTYPGFPGVSPLCHATSLQGRQLAAHRPASVVQQGRTSTRQRWQFMCRMTNS